MVSFDLSGLYSKIKSDPIVAGIIATVIGGIILAILLGAWSYFTKRNFKRGFILVFKWLYLLIELMLRSLKWVLIGIIKPLIKPIVIEILNECKKDNNKGYLPMLDDNPWMIMELKNESGFDDCCFPFNLNLSEWKYRIKVDSISGNYWRIGFKLSKTGVFTTSRLLNGFPLIHLTKNLNEPVLNFTRACH